MNRALDRKPGKALAAKVQATGNAAAKVELSEMDATSILMHRIRYFSDGAVIGSKAFVNEAFKQARERFGPNRKDGARKLEGAAEAAAGHIWSARGLRVDV